MAYPDTAPVRELILQDVVSSLQDIDGTGSFHTDIEGRVFRDTGQNAFALSEYPAAIVSTPRVAYTDNTTTMQSATMDLTVRVVLQGDEDQQEELAWLVEDVKVALTADVQRGDLALTTQITGDETFQSDDMTPIAAADVFVTIRFRHLYGDPSTAV